MSLFRVDLKSRKWNRWNFNDNVIIKNLLLLTQLQDGSRLTFSYISSSLTFPGAYYRISLLFLPWLPWHCYLVVIETQQHYHFTLNGKPSVNKSSLTIEHFLGHFFSHQRKSATTIKSFLIQDKPKIIYLAFNIQEILNFFSWIKLKIEKLLIQNLKNLVIFCHIFLPFPPHV